MKQTSDKCPRLILCFVAVLIACIGLQAQIPYNYYRNISGKSGEELKTALHKLLYDHTLVSSYQDLPNYFKHTDVYPPGNQRYGQWWEMYGNEPFYLPSFYGMHREHSVPKSWWGGSTETPAYTDLNHLYPAEGEANEAKYNYPLGEVATATYENGVTTVGRPVSGQGGGAAQVFEPADEYKGDFARTYMYVATCYQNLHWKYTYMFNNNTYPTLNLWSADLLMRWHREDPVSQKEIDRNNQVYKVQFNRNPFIDFPELAEYLWGNLKGYTWNLKEPVQTEPELITPINNMELEFGQVAVGKSETISLRFEGTGLTGSLSLRFSPKSQKCFSVKYTEIPTSWVNDKVFWLEVTFTPTEVGMQEVYLGISDGGMQGSLAAVVRGEGCAVPALQDIKALEATDVTPYSYIAHWEVPGGDAPDYYEVRRTINIPGQAPEVVTELAETNMLKIAECTPGSSESYSVRSCRLGYYSAYSNEVYVTLGAGTQSVENDVNPLVALRSEGGVTFMCAQPHTNVRIIDMQGRLVAVLPSIGAYQFQPLAPGAYLITSDSQTRPVSVMAGY